MIGKSALGSPLREICTMGSERGDEYKRPCSLGEGTGSKESEYSEAPQRATTSRLLPTHQLGGTSKESWEKAAIAAVNKAGKTLRDLRVAEVGRLDMQLKNGKVDAFRARVTVSFKYEGGT